MTEIDKRFAKELDKKLAKLYDKQFDLKLSILGAKDTIKHIEKYSPNNEYRKSSAVRYVQDLEQEYEQVTKELKEAEKYYTGWSRAFLVVNSNGHIHSSMECSTCFSTTRFVWLTEMSAEDRLEVAKLAGEKACTICYPDAPSEYFLRKCELEDPEVVKARAEREQRREQIRQERELKGIKDLDGTPLKVNEYGRYRQELKTLRSAEIWVVDAGVFIEEYEEKPRPHQEAEYKVKKSDYERVIKAIAVKRNVPTKQVGEEVAKKVAKKVEQSRKALERWLQQNPQYR